MRTKDTFFRDNEFTDRDPGFRENHAQRCTIAQWRDALLNNQDRFIVGGNLVELVGKDIGFGVVEVRIKNPIAL